VRRGAARPGGATKQLPARRYLALEGGLTAEPAWAVERRRRRPQEHGWASQRAVARRGGPGGPDAGRAVVSLSTSWGSVRCPVSGVCALPRALCPADVRSWSAAVGRQPCGWDGRGRRGRPLRPCPARRLPESAPRVRSWRRRCWASRGFGLDLAVVVGRWLGSGQLDRVADQERPGARQDGSSVGIRVYSEACLLRQADRHAVGESLGRSCSVEPNIEKPTGHIPLARQN
jgi:hypothetical protein